MPNSTADEMTTSDEVPPPVPPGQPKPPAPPELPEPPAPPLPQPVGGYATVGFVAYSLPLDFAKGIQPTMLMHAVRSVLTTAHAADPEWSEDRCELLMRTSLIRWAPDPSQVHGEGTVQLVVPITAPGQLSLTPPPGGRGRRRVRAPGLLRNDAGALAVVNAALQRLTTVAKAVVELARLMNQGLDMAVVHARLAKRFEVDSQVLHAYLRSTQPAFTARVHDTTISITKPALDKPSVRDADARPARLQPRPAVARPLNLRVSIEGSDSAKKNSRRVRKVAVASHHVGIRTVLAGANAAGVPIDGFVTEPRDGCGPNQVGPVLTELTNIEQLISTVIAVISSAATASEATESTAVASQRDLFVVFAERPDEDGAANADTKEPEGS